MYHSVTTQSSESKGLTIDVKQLEAQLLYLKSEGYTTFHFKDLQLINSAKDFPKKAVIITFDDVYVNQLKLAYPLFLKYNLKACFYIPLKYVGGVNTWDEGEEPIMSVQQLQSLDGNVIELGLHSFAHQRYDQLSIEEIQKDFDLCRQFIVHNKLEINNTLAYPYGKYPKTGEEQHAFFKCLKKNQIAYGLRIGNRVNRFPFKDHYEIQRIDIKGDDTLKTFKRKLKKGKRWF